MWKKKEPKKSPSLKSQMENDVGVVVGSSTGGFGQNRLERRERRGRAGAGTSKRGKESADAMERERERESRERRRKREKCGRGKRLVKKWRTKSFA